MDRKETDNEIEDLGLETAESIVKVLITADQQLQRHTFRVANVEVNQQLLKEVTYRKAIESKIGIVESYLIDNENKTLIPSEGIHPLIATLYYAFNDHRPISISPDAIWLLIAQGFSQHINENSETLRKKMVSWAGKRTLVVRRDDFVMGKVDNAWDEVFPEFTKQIREHSDDEIYSLVVQNFSTTNKVEKAAFELTLMEAMKSYFSYRLETICGIPTITLEGTQADWQKIVEKTKQLRNYGLEDWVDELLPVLGKFVEVFVGKVDGYFWNRIFKWIDSDSSGSYPFIDGWILKFFPYLFVNKKVWKNKFIKRPIERTILAADEVDEDFKEQWFSRVDRMRGPGFEHIPNGLSKTDFIWEYYQKESNMQFFAGFVGISQDKETRTLRPEIGWAVKINWLGN